MDTTPPVLPPDQLPPIRTADDMFQAWRAFMGRLGFSDRSLWCAYVTSDGRIVPTLQKIDKVPGWPDPKLLDGLMEMCGAVLDGACDGGTVAFLLSRPGTSGFTASDRSWGRELALAAARAGIRLQPIHLATDEAVRVFAGDDLMPGNDT